VFILGVKDPASPAGRSGACQLAVDDRVVVGQPPLGIGDAADEGSRQVAVDQVDGQLGDRQAVLPGLYPDLQGEGVAGLVEPQLAERAGAVCRAYFGSL